MQNSKLSTRVLSTRVPYDYYIKIVGLAKDNKMTVSDYVALIIHSPEEKKSFKEPAAEGSDNLLSRIKELTFENEDLKQTIQLRDEEIKKELEENGHLRRALYQVRGY
jgi:hypothetical protein